jgi:hypothetical protein
MSKLTTDEILKQWEKNNQRFDDLLAGRRDLDGHYSEKDGKELIGCLNKHNDPPRNSHPITK